MNGSAKPRTLAPVRPMRNEDVSQALEEVGDLLESQQANPFRAMAYRHAADSVRRLEQPVADMLAEGGIAALTQLPGVGESLARVIAEICETGRLGLIERLRGEVSAETLLATVPGVGAELAKRIHEQLGVGTLEELEIAAFEGRLASVRGFGARQTHGVIEALAGRLGRRARAPASIRAEPPVDELLDVDREYRERAAAGTLHRINQLAVVENRRLLGIVTDRDLRDAFPSILDVLRQDLREGPRSFSSPEEVSVGSPAR